MGGFWKEKRKEMGYFVRPVRRLGFTEYWEMDVGSSNRSRLVFLDIVLHIGWPSNFPLVLRYNILTPRCR